MVNLKMRSICNRCERNGYSYVFFFDHASFEEAEANCRGANGSLASDLNKETYLKFNECCFNTPGLQYYVGLVVNGQCKQNSRGPFLWVGSNNCTNGWPLSNLNPQSNPTCQSVAIIINNAKNMLPTSTLLHCTTGQRYICQFQISSALSPTITSITSSGTVGSSFRAVNNSVARNHVLTLGVVIGAVTLIFLLALFFCCTLCFKKRYTKNNKNNQNFASKNKSCVHFRNNPLPEK